MQFKVWDNGDASVGIAGNKATVETDVNLYDGKYQQDYIDTIKQALVETFQSIWSNGHVYVMTDQEMAAYQGD